MPFGRPDGLSAKDKRIFMAKVFEKTQNTMSKTVDDIGLATRAPVPYPSKWEAKYDVAERGPIPTDAHLIPSNMVVIKPDPPVFVPSDEGSEPLHLSGKPFYAYRKPTPSIFPEARETAPPAAAHKPKIDREMWLAQYMEWTLQKNAYNPDIAAQMRTNVRKQASLSMIDPSDIEQDPARTSENVKAALTFNENQVGAYSAPKEKLALHNVFPEDYSED